MAVNQQTLLKIQSLEQLYRNGYHSNTVDAAIDKLVGLEQTRVEQELTRLEERLHKLEAQYHLDHLRRWDNRMGPFPPHVQPGGPSGRPGCHKS